MSARAQQSSQKPVCLSFEQVQEAERKALGIGGRPAEDTAALCLSGGGIRSATFALGVLQGLAARGLLPDFHYLSTVSGGGYVGGWFTAWCSRAGLQQVAEDLRDPRSAPIQWLREYSNYLSPRTGLFSASTWTLVAIVVRNILLNLCVLVPIFLSAVAIPRICLSLIDEPRDPWILLAAAAAFALFGMIWPPLWVPSLCPNSKIPKWRTEGRFVLLHSVPLATAVILASAAAYQARACIPALGTIGAARDFSLAGLWIASLGWATGCVLARRRPGLPELVLVPGLGALTGVWLHLLLRSSLVGRLTAPPELFVTLGMPVAGLWMLPVTCLLVALASYQGFRRRMDENDREWWARAIAWLMILGTVWAAWAAIVLLVPLLLKQLGDVWAWALSLGGGTVGGLAARLIGWRAAASAGAARTGASRLSTAAGRLGRLARKIAAPAAIVAMMAGLSMLCVHERLGGVAWWWPLAGIAVGWVVSYVLSVNRFSLNELYRTRLMRAYLGASRGKERRKDPFTGFDAKDNLFMADIEQDRPLHIVNLALNVTGGQELAWQNRKARSFTISKFHSGYFDANPEAPCYRHSGHYTNGGISMATAMSLSGAAASPNMGYHSSKPLTFLMAVFNARLGAWLPNTNPNGAAVAGQDNPTDLRVFLREMLGLAGTDSKWIYLSDGGHFENLGLYEMLRRGCRHIVVSDASADPDYTFEDLANAIHKARVDLSVRVHWVRRPDFHKERARKDGAHFGLLEAHFPGGGEPGWILYLKPSFSGIEAGQSPDVFRYAADHPDFPHESTADQFFDEAQFESYRRLGEQTVESLPAAKTLAALFDELAARSAAPPKGPQD